MAGKRILISLLFLSPLSVFANAGTPLMWAGMLHLVFGNLLLGAAEGVLLAIVFKRPKAYCVLVMIAANYASAWLAGLPLANWAEASDKLDLYTARAFVWKMAAFAFAATLLVEWPFVALCLRKAPGWLSKSLIGNLAIHVCSYGVLALWYLGVSHISLITQLNPVPPSTITPDQPIRVAFIDAAAGHVYAIDLPGGSQQKLRDVASTNGQDRLVLQSNPEGSWDLNVRFDTSAMPDADIPLVNLLPGYSRIGVVKANQDRDQRKTWFNFGYLDRLPNVQTNEWRYQVGFWAAGGIAAERIATEKYEHFAFETPFGSWPIRNATQISENQVVFQLGDDQICILDRARKQIARVANGRGPVVVPQELNSGLGQPQLSRRTGE